MNICINDNALFNLTKDGQEYLRNLEIYPFNNSPISLKKMFEVFGSTMFVGSDPIITKNIFSVGENRRLFNLNDQVTFHLTQKGKFYFECFAQNEKEELNIPEKYIRKLKLQEDGSCEMTLHEFGYIFGKGLTGGDLIENDSLIKK